MAEPITEEELMNRVKHGQRQDLSVLMRRYANPLLTFLRRMTGDHHSSEELFQDVFLAIWVQRREYEYPRPFRPWLFGIAANKCRTNYRKRIRQPATDGDELSMVANTGSPHESAVATETATIVEQAVLQLPDQQRQVVVMRVWNEMSYQAIARILDCTEATARSHMFHAVNSMRRFLEPRLNNRDS